MHHKAGADLYTSAEHQPTKLQAKKSFQIKITKMIYIDRESNMKPILTKVKVSVKQNEVHEAYDPDEISFGVLQNMTLSHYMSGDIILRKWWTPVALYLYWKEYTKQRKLNL